MKIFITGATGFIGSKVTRILLDEGHEVVGLARSDNSEDKLKAMGAEALRGNLSDLDVLKKGALEADGVIHLGFTNDFDHFDESVKQDIAAVAAMGSVLEGTGKPFVNTSGTLNVPNLGRLATEDDEPTVHSGRDVSEDMTIKMADKNVRSSVVRLSPTVHDQTRQGFGSILAMIAIKSGVSAYVDEGKNAWPSIQADDAAQLFVKALMSAPAGTILHGSTEEGIATKDIAETIGKVLNIPVQSVTKDEADKTFGWFGQPMMVDDPTSSVKTQELLNWHPEGNGLLEDIQSFLSVDSNVEMLKKM